MIVKAGDRLGYMEYMDMFLEEGPRRVTLKGVQIIAEKYCPTWRELPLTGWRRYLARVFPDRWFKHKRERVIITMNHGQQVICSPENYALIHDGTFPL